MEECVYPETDLTEKNKNLLVVSYNNQIQYQMVLPSH